MDGSDGEAAEDLVAPSCTDGDVVVTSASSRSEALPTLAPSPASWSDLWNIPDETAVHTLFLALGGTPARLGRNASALEAMAYDLCQSGSCSLDQLAQLCLLL